jgi:hypothetical protein
MLSPLQDLQFELTKDLIKFETSNLSEEQLDLIEQTYQEVYFKLQTLDRRD